MEIKTESLTNLQLELLKVFSFKLPEDEILAVRRLLASHFADRMKDEASKIWLEKGYSKTDMDKCLEYDEDNNPKNETPQNLRCRTGDAISGELSLQ